MAGNGGVVVDRALSLPFAYMPTDMMWSTNSSLSLKLTWTSLILPLAELFFFFLASLDLVK